MDSRERGMTLIELLAVIALVGLLVALLLPAVQMAREAARRAQCANHLKQLGLASIEHEHVHSFFPSGGWGSVWVGDPDQGFGRTQPGGWAYSVLPYLEQDLVHQAGRDANATLKKTAAIRLVTTALPVFYCPSRRSVQLYPHDPKSTPPLNPGIDGVRLERDDIPLVARMCYCMNAGSVFLGHPSVPPDMAHVPNFPAWADTSLCNGIVYQRSQTRVSDVGDGTSNTYLIGEKNVNPDCYASFSAPGDSQSMFNGWDEDNARYGGKDTRTGHTEEYPLVPDRPGVACHQCFGSPHAGVCLFVFCDGSVHAIESSVDLVVHGDFATRNDGHVAVSGPSE
jgi:prepilin-type N-terminal cleavage/methylation domain-containing protein